MKEKFIQFMQGRYGIDYLGKFLFGLGVVFLFISILFRGNILGLLGWIVIIAGYVRLFSKNHSSRYKENQQYLRITSPVRNFFVKCNYMAKERIHNHIYNCPSCKQKIRVPKNKGKIEVRCPKCNTKFIKIS
jgi:membrane-bound ClpP family serine protease